MAQVLHGGLAFAYLLKGMAGEVAGAIEGSRSLKTLTGSWSDLALACLIHVGMKRLMPDEDSGLGIGAEYEEALRLHGP
ncbi:hypothetical protein KBZ20_12685 [Vulcanococcus limneticus Candia 3F8]|uniref:hypothetical protein n=1 Tax=Vulcanococcus limneticus TaxID=2170428 RepID=UPI000B986352|nr:hypothetical protein [Vulcanococcus limneticus]MCP9791632.1 hypothetical protein [Vulcanococcus limneticus MW73D5]MCP9894628.1 hypothetical protein [Vulcanococcus limneticus Candia 3F8]MCP9897085.1 hypothetical protein [Vulcanococcus limneticus Candia 3B3]